MGITTDWFSVVRGRRGTAGKEGGREGGLEEGRKGRWEAGRDGNSRGKRGREGGWVRMRSGFVGGGTISRQQLGIQLDDLSAGPGGAVVPPHGEAKSVGGCRILGFPMR